MKISTFSAQQFKDRQSLTFSQAKYSSFKYGSKSVAREFGYELGTKFIQSDVYRNLETEYDLAITPIIVSSAPYKFIPTASFALKDYFVHEFNRYHALKWGRSVEELKVFRQHSYFDDYGSMSRKAREQAITSEDFYLDQTFIKDKILFSIDDIKITGAHQSRIEQLLRTIGFEGHVVFLFYGELTGLEAPQIESYLNRNSINDLKDINGIIREDEFIFNTRVVKFILHAEAAEFKSFIEYQSAKFNETLLHYAIGNEYFKQAEFKDNLELLLEYLKYDTSQTELCSC